VDAVLREEGNVLFLILIAVALFAALSYAVTSSTRSQGDGGKEGTLITSASITQYPASVSMEMRQMEASVEDVRFNKPSEFANLPSTAMGVFHPDGGGATYSAPPKDAMNEGKAGEWFFNAELEVPDIGTTNEGRPDVIAYLPGIKKSVCSKINLEYGLGSSVPILSSDQAAAYTKNMVNDGVSDYIVPDTDVPDIDDGAGAFRGQPFGCFQNGGGQGDYVYYHVIAER
jgi:hypothetical protein